MNRVGLLILGGLFAAAAVLLVVWFIGFQMHIGGASIHLLLVVAVLKGFIGAVVGIVVLLTGKKT